jgi:hypothetical protein
MPVKGEFDGECNRRACRETGANWWNPNTRAYYCASCARRINDYIVRPEEQHLRLVPSPSTVGDGR